LGFIVVILILGILKSTGKNTENYSPEENQQYINNILQSVKIYNQYLIDFYQDREYPEIDGCVLYFDIEYISSKITTSYGRYCYNEIFKLFRGPSCIDYLLCDGDLIEEESRIVTCHNMDKNVIEIVSKKHSYAILIAGHFSYNTNIGFFDGYFKDNVAGYIGMTTLISNDYKGYLNYAIMAKLVPALTVNGVTITKLSFNYLTDNELKDRGYYISDKSL